MTHKTIAFIGAGNMATCLITGLCQTGYSTQHIWASNPNSSQLNQLVNSYNIRTSTDNRQAAEQADCIVLAVKPQIIATVLAELAPVIHKQLLISVAAGVTTGFMQKFFKQPKAIIRAMPNTPALVGCGATGLFANPFVSEADRTFAEQLFKAVGELAWLPEEQMLNTLTALSGSGPAYMYLLLESLTEAAEQNGLPADISQPFALQTMLGAAMLAKQTGTSFAELRSRVTSKGGTTEAAILALQTADFSNIIKKAIVAATLRAEQLAAT